MSPQIHPLFEVCQERLEERAREVSQCPSWVLVHQSLVSLEDWVGQAKDLRLQAQDWLGTGLGQLLPMVHQLW